MSNVRPTFPVGINVFVIKDGKLLLGRRCNTGWMDGTWGVPGGHLEEKEGMKACAARELLEETGMTAEDFELQNVVNDATHNSRHYIHVNFLAKNAKGNAEVREPDRCEEWRWFDLGNLPKELFPGHAKGIELLLSGKTNFLDN